MTKKNKIFRWIATIPIFFSPFILFSLVLAFIDVIKPVILGETVDMNDSPFIIATLFSFICGYFGPLGSVMVAPSQKFFVAKAISFMALLLGIYAIYYIIVHDTFFRYISLSVISFLVGVICFAYPLLDKGNKEDYEKMDINN